jgi:hypothetical protein
MPTNRHPIRHPRRGRLSHDQEMTLLYGEEPRWFSVPTEAEHRDAWARNRDRILASHRHGRRPMAWWRFEAPIKFPGYEHQQSALFEAGLLTEEERAELASWWREQFERAQRADFFFCEGPGSFFRGSVARRKHYAWADIPRELVRKWTAEHKPRAKTIRKLQATTKGPPGEETAGL